MAFALAAGDDLVGRFITVDGTRLHYVAAGKGTQVVLLHGNGSMIGDFLSSGIVERLSKSHRVIVFDRPGFGHSERPPGREWGPFEQAQLLSRALVLLGIEQPVVVGHSWGTLVALAMGLEGLQNVAGLVLLSGYYYPVPLPQTSTQKPAFRIGDHPFRHAFEPIFSRWMAAAAVRRVFAPCAVPVRFQNAYSIPHALRPSQVRAVKEEATMLAESARMLSQRYREISIPVHLIAGSEDGIVSTPLHSTRLHQELPASMYLELPGVGHMVHHAAPDHVVKAIEAVGERSLGTWAARMAASAGKSKPREWLHIGESYDEHVAAAA